MKWRALRLSWTLLPACTAVHGVALEEHQPDPGRVESPKPGPAAPPARPDALPEPRDPPRLLTDPGSGVLVVWAGAAAASTVAGSELVVLEPDRRHLSAYDWLDGEPHWRIELDVSAAVQLLGLGDRVLLHDRDRVIVVEAARGRVLGQHIAPASGPWPHVYEVQQRQGACAWVGPCGIQPFDCENGAPTGAYLASDELHLYGVSDDPSEHSTACSPKPKLLGQYGDSIVLVAGLPSDDGAATGGVGASLLGLEPSSGEPRWQQPLPEGHAPTGATVDGACWILNEREPRISVFDCADGALRWERDVGPGTLEVYGAEGSFVVSREQSGRWRLSAYRATDGQPQWSARLARRQRPLFPQGSIPGAQALGARRSYALIEPAEGRVVGELVAGREETLWRDPIGGFVLIGRDLRELDLEGRLVRQRPFSASRVYAVAMNHLLVYEGAAIAFLDREQLRERARLEGRLSIDAAAKLPSDRLLLQRHGEDGVALVLALDAPSRAGLRRD